MSNTEQSVESVAIDASEAWRAFGRDTEAGRLMYNIYGGKFKDNYTPNVKIKTKASDPQAEHRARILAKAQQVKERKASVEVPDPLPRRELDPELLLRWKLAGAHRKPARSIQRELEADKRELMQQARRPYHPQPSRDEKITQAQTLMEFRGKPPTEEEKSALKSKHYGSAYDFDDEPPLDPFQIRMNEIVAEVQDREKFLHEMEAMGQGKKYEFRIKGEIAELLRELRQIGERVTGKRDHTSFVHLTSAATTKAASRAAVSQGSVGAGSDSVAALFAPQSPTSIALLSSPTKNSKRGKKKIEDFDPNALEAPPSEFDVMSGKAIKDLEVQYAAAQAFGIGGNASARSQNNSNNNSSCSRINSGRTAGASNISSSFVDDAKCRRVPSAVNPRLAVHNAGSGGGGGGGGGGGISFTVTNKDSNSHSSSASNHHPNHQPRRSESPQPTSFSSAPSLSAADSVDDGESIFTLSAAKASSPPQSATSICRLPPIRSARARD